MLCILAGGDADLKVIDIGNPAALQTNTVHVVGDYAYVADTIRGLVIVQLGPTLAFDPPGKSGNTLLLSWSGGAGVKLQKSTTLKNPIWLAIPEAEGTNRVSVPLSDGAGFFRLVKP